MTYKPFMRKRRIEGMKFLEYFTHGISGNLYYGLEPEPISLPFMPLMKIKGG